MCMHTYVEIHMYVSNVCSYLLMYVIIIIMIIVIISYLNWVGH